MIAPETIASTDTHALLRLDLVTVDHWHNLRQADKLHDVGWGRTNADQLANRAIAMVDPDNLLGDLIRWE